MTDPDRVAGAAGARSGELHPIIPGFFPDPSVCRAGDDYYLAASSFEYFPGVPIFRSRDLVSWTQVGNALTRRSQLRCAATASSGVFAPTLRHHDGVFWLITTNVADFGAGQVIVHATDPAGEWSEPVFVPEAIGIDPDLVWDEDGTCYLTWHDLDFQVGGKGIRQAPLDLATGRLRAPAYDVWQGTGLVAAEAPHLYRIGEYWYQLLAEGGTERGHCVTVARSRELRGPWEPHPANPVLTRRSTGHPVQNTGHADLVPAPDGGWAAVYLGVRPAGPTPKFHVLGRETFLAGVDWVDGWPVFDVGRFDVPDAVTSFADTFEAGMLHPRWIAPAGEPARIAAFDDGPGVALTAPSAGERPDAGLLCFRVQDLRWSADAVVEGPVGFRLRVDERHWYGLSVGEGGVRVEAQIGDLVQVSDPVATGRSPVTLRIQGVEPTRPAIPFGPAGPDEIVLSVVTVDGPHELARWDGRYLSTEVAGGFTGRVLGLTATGPGARVHAATYMPVRNDETDR